MMEQPNGETNEPSAPTDSGESAWQTLRTAIRPTTVGTAEGRSMDERPGAVPDPRGDGSYAGNEDSTDGIPTRASDHRRTPTAGRCVVSVGEDGTAESRPVSDGGTTLSHRYTVDITAKTDHGVASHAIASNDVSETFEKLLRWYATQVAPDEDPAAVLDVLLSACDLE